MIYRIKDFFTKLKMGLLFFKRGFNSNSWDAGEIYLDIAQRLEICYTTFREDDMYLWCDSENSKQMRNIRECIELCKRMNSGRFNKNIIRLMEKYRTKRGELSLGSSLFPDAKLLDVKLYTYFFRKASQKDDRHYKDRKERLNKLISEGIELWGT